MKNKTGLLRFLWSLTVLFAVGCAGLRTWMLVNAYRVSDGFYTNDSAHLVLRIALAGFALLSFAAGWLLYNKEGKSSKNADREAGSPFLPLPENTFTAVCSILCGLAFFGFILFFVAKPLISGVFTADVKGLLLCLFAFFAGLYYMTNHKRAARGGEFRSLLCISAALFLLVMVFGLYFDKSVSYINHTVMLAFAAGVFSMLAVTAEANFALHRSAYRRYVCYAPASVVLTVSLALPDLLFFIRTKEVLVTNLYYDILLLAIGLTHFARLTAIAFPKKEN